MKVKKMSVSKPYKRTVRIFTDGEYGLFTKWKYILHPQYAKAPEHYIRSFLLIQQDLQSLFAYIESADTNGPTYSFRIHELLMRTCMEVEANCKIILKRKWLCEEWQMDFAGLQED